MPSWCCTMSRLHFASLRSPFLPSCLWPPGDSRNQCCVIGSCPTNYATDWCPHALLSDGVGPLVMEVEAWGLFWWYLASQVLQSPFAQEDPSISALLTLQLEHYLYIFSSTTTYLELMTYDQQAYAMTRKEISIYKTRGSWYWDKCSCF